MQPSFATELGWLRASSALTATLARGESYAVAQSHRLVMLEHVLLALTEDEDAAAVLQGARIDLARLRDDVAGFLGRLNDRLLPGEGNRPQVHPDLRRILEYAAQAAQRSRRPQINGAVLIAAIVGEGRSVAANILKSHGLTFQDAIRSLQRQPPAQEHPAAPPAMQPPPPSRAERPAPPAPGPAGAPLQPLSASPFPQPSIPPFAAPPAAPPPPASRAGIIPGLPPEPPLPQAQGAEQQAGEPWAPRPPAISSEQAATMAAREAILAQARERVHAPRPAPGSARQGQRSTQEQAWPPAEAPPAPAAVEAQAGADSAHEPPAAAPSAVVPAQQAGPEPVSADVLIDEAPQAAEQADAAAPLHDAHDTILIDPGQLGEPPADAPPPPDAAVPPPLPEPPPLPRVHPHHPLPIQPSAARAPRGPAIPWPEAADDGTAAASGVQPRPRQAARPAAMRPEPADAVPAPWPELAAPAHQAAAAPPPQPYDGNFAGAPYPAPEEVLASLGGQPSRRPSGEPRLPPPAAPEIDKGQLVENIPRVMRVGITQTMEVRIARAGTDTGQRPLQGGGVSFHHRVHVTRTMAARLRSPQGGFIIEPLSPETQWVESRLGPMHDGFATWRWAVTPLKRGSGVLQLVVSARAVDLDGVVAETALPDQVFDVKVRINYARALRQWGGWLAAMVAGGVLGKFGEGLVEHGIVALKRIAGL